MVTLERWDPDLFSGAHSSRRAGEEPQPCQVELSTKRSPPCPNHPWRNWGCIWLYSSFWAPSLSRALLRDSPWSISSILPPLSQATYWTSSTAHRLTKFHFKKAVQILDGVHYNGILPEAAHPPLLNIVAPKMLVCLPKRLGRSNFPPLAEAWNFRAIWNKEPCPEGVFQHHPGRPATVLFTLH